MDEQDFLENYLKPSDHRLDKRFTHPLPPIPGLENKGEFIVQGKLGHTFSTNIVYKYESKNQNIRLVDVYKCSEHTQDGVFVRLVGTMSLVKSGFPFLFLDAAVTNVSPITCEREEITTRVVVHMPQATSAQREIVFDNLLDKADGDRVTHKKIDIPHMPDFWGPILLLESKALDFKLIEEMRDTVAHAYLTVIDKTEINQTIDYTEVKTHMLYTTAKNEGMLFEKLGLTVPVEAQSAFFSLMTAGVENP